MKNQINFIGTTKSGKLIHQEPDRNQDFKKQDHLDAYKAHANFLMHRQLLQSAVEQHRMAMNEHYLLAVQAE